MRPPEFDLKTIRGLPSIEEEKAWRAAGATFAHLEDGPDALDKAMWRKRPFSFGIWFDGNDNARIGLWCAPPKDGADG